MIQELFRNIAHFRSQMLMSKYEKAKDNGSNILNMLGDLKNMGIDKQQIEQIASYIQTQLNICVQIQNMLENKQKQLVSTSRKRLTDYQPKDNHRKKSYSSGRQKFKSKQFSQKKKSPSTKIYRHCSPKQCKKLENVGKWGRGKRTKSQTAQKPIQQNQSKFSTKTEEFISQPLIPISPKSSQKIQPIKEEDQIQGIRLDHDQIQILERELILPIKMPEFFKNTQPHRLLVCYYEKCSELLKKINSQLKIANIIQMNFIGEYHAHSIQKNRAGYILIVAPYSQKQIQMIRKIIKDSDIILVLYADRNRMLLAEKPTKVINCDINIQF